MCFICKNWKIIDVSYNERNGEVEVSGVDVEDIIFGFTKVTQRCKKCGKLRFYKETGRVNISVDYD